MSTVVLTGNYHDGIIELLSFPSGLKAGRVRVVVLPDANEHALAPTSAKYLTFGMFRKEDGSMSTEEDFAEAEWHEELEFEATRDE